MAGLLDRLHGWLSSSMRLLWYTWYTSPTMSIPVNHWGYVLLGQRCDWVCLFQPIYRCCNCLEGFCTELLLYANLNVASSYAWSRIHHFRFCQSLACVRCIVWYQRELFLERSIWTERADFTRWSSERAYMLEAESFDCFSIYGVNSMGFHFHDQYFPAGWARITKCWMIDYHPAFSSVSLFECSRSFESASSVVNTPVFLMTFHFWRFDGKVGIALRC